MVDAFPICLSALGPRGSDTDGAVGETGTFKEATIVGVQWKGVTEPLGPD
jgi:hypothetical protein